MVTSVRNKNNRGAADNSYRWSPSIWGGFPIQAIKEGSVKGVIQEWDFANGFKTSTNVNAAEAYWDQGLMVFGSDGATVTADKTTGMNSGISLASDGDNEGAAIRSQFQPFKIARSQRRLAFEAFLFTSTITDTKHGIFTGLCDSTAATATVPIAAAGTLADLNFVGFHRLEGDGDKLDFVYKANGVTQVTTLADAVTLAVDTVVSVGFVYEPDIAPNEYGTSGRYTLRAYANNVALNAVKTIPSTDGDDFPNDIGLGFIFSILNATASTPGDSTICRVRCAQLIDE